MRHTACSHKSVHPASLDFMGGGACHEALQHDAHLSKADKGVEVTDTRGGSITCAAEHQALDPRHLRNGLHRDDGGSRSIFLPPRRVRAPPASGVLLQNSIAARGPGYAGATSWPLPAPVSAPWAKSRRQVKSWFRATPWRRATKRTVMPGSNVSSTIWTFSDAVQRDGA